MSISTNSLDNGLRYSIAKKNGSVVTALVLVGAGSRYEPRQLLGMSHLLEHLLFRGSKHYPNSTEITKLFDELGAKFNAFADKDISGYHVKVDKSKYKKALSILADFVQYPLLRESNIKEEKAIVFAELEQRNDDPRQFNLYSFQDHVFKGHPLEKNVGGTQKTIKTISRKNLIDYHQRYYTPQNMTVVLAGDLKDSESRKLISKLFGSKPKLVIPKPDTPIFIPFPPHHKTPRVFVEKRKLNQDHIILGFPIFGVRSKLIFPTELMTKILGGLSSSRLFQEVRENLGLVYHISAEPKVFLEGGYVSIEFSCEQKNTKKAITTTLHEISKLKRELISKDEFKRIQENIKSSTTLRKENTLKLATFIAMQTIYKVKPLYSFDNYLKQFKKVSRKNIKEVSNLIFDKNNLVVMVTGGSSQKHIEDIIKKTKF